MAWNVFPDNTARVKMNYKCTIGCFISDQIHFDIFYDSKETIESLTSNMHAKMSMRPPRKNLNILRMEHYSYFQ